MSVKFGLDAKLYINPDGNEDPIVPANWDLLANARDVTLTMETGEADVTTRANGGWRATLATLKDASVEFEMVWDTEDGNFTAIQQAFMNRTGLGVAVMDGALDASASQGLVATMMVTNFSRNEPLEEAITVSVSMKPTYDLDYAPRWQTVA